MIACEVVKARGHPLVRATHRSTLEITRDPQLTPRGDCIIAVNADKGALHLSPYFKSVASRDSARVIAALQCGDTWEAIGAWGASKLTFTDPNSIVIRRSAYIDGRTVAVKSDKAAAHISRELVSLLKRANALVVYLIAYTLDEEREAWARLSELTRTRADTKAE